MKESEFIELLNLYLDHEISSSDAARLEAEVQNRPERRKVYQQYCRMQKACKVLAVDFQTDDAVSATEKKIIAFDPVAEATAQRGRMNRFYTIGAIAAAAACIAIIFIGRARQHASETSQPGAIMAVAPATPPVAKPPQATQVANTSSLPRALGGRPTATLVADPLLLTHDTQAEPVYSTAAKEANEQLAWINSVQLTPLQQGRQADALRFDLPSTPLRPEARTLRSNRAPTEASVEMTAFQFQK